jgi:mobilization protein MobC
MPDHGMRRQRRVEGGSPMRINVRTTMHTYAALAAASKVAGLSVPRFLIESALHESTGGWSLRQQRWWAERLDVVETRLIRIGTNLNQMTAVTNTTGQPPDGLAAALTYLTATLDRHRAVLDAIDPADRTRLPRS